MRALELMMSWGLRLICPNRSTPSLGAGSPSCVAAPHAHSNSPILPAIFGIFDVTQRVDIQLRTSPSATVLYLARVLVRHGVFRHVGHPVVRPDSCNLAPRRASWQTAGDLFSRSRPPAPKELYQPSPFIGSSYLEPSNGQL